MSLLVRILNTVYIRVLNPKYLYLLVVIRLSKMLESEDQLRFPSRLSMSRGEILGHTFRGSNLEGDNSAIALTILEN